MGGFVDDIKESVGNVIEATVAVTGGSIKVVTNTIAGGSTSDALAEVGAGVNKGLAASSEIGTFGQGDKIDALSGGLYSASQGMSNLGGDLLQGKSVRQDLKDTARVGAVAGATIYGGPAAGMAVNSAMVGADGKSQVNLKSISRAGGAYIGGGAGNILKAIGKENAPTPTRPSNSGISQGGYFSDLPSEIFQGADKNLVVPVLIILTIVTVIIIKKQRK